MEAININTLGKVKDITKDRMIELTFTPGGQWNAGIIAALWPWGAVPVGTSLFGATDTTCVITSRAGTKVTLKAAAVTKMPSLIFSAVKTLAGSCTILGLSADDTAWSATTDPLAAAAALTYTDSTFDPDDIIIQPYVVAWGAVSPWDNIQTEDGVQVDFNMVTKPHVIDTYGTIDHTLETLEVTAKMKPRNVTEAQLIAAMSLSGTGMVRGRSMAALAKVLSMTGTGLSCTLPKAAITEGGMDWGNSTPRMGELTFKSQMTFATGVAQPLFILA